MKIVRLTIAFIIVLCMAFVIDLTINYVLANTHHWIISEKVDRIVINIGRFSIGWFYLYPQIKVISDKLSN